MKDNIKEVDRAFLDALFDSDGYEPRGAFLCADEVEGKLVYVAVDNRNGCAFTEEFNIKMYARRWLNGKTSINRWGEILNGDDNA